MKKILTRIAALGATDGELPEWYLIFSEGWNEIEGEGSFLVDQQGWTVVSGELIRRGIEIVVDYEHQTIEGSKAPAAGWCREWRYRDGIGIEARIEWTAEAAQFLEKGEYRYYSPVFYVRESDKRLVGVHSVALTNSPKTNHIQPLLAKLGAKQQQEESMDLLKQLAKALGLDVENASNEDVVAAVTKLQDNPSVDDQIVAVLDLKEDKTVSAVVASINVLKQEKGNMVPVEDFNKLRDQVVERDAKEVVAKAMQDGKVAPAQKDWATTYAKSDLGGFKKFVEDAPVVVPVTKLPAGGGGPDGSTEMVDLSDRV